MSLTDILRKQPGNLDLPGGHLLAVDGLQPRLRLLDRWAVKAPFTAEPLLARDSPWRLRNDGKQG